MICQIVKAELYYGAYKSARRDANLALLTKFFNQFESLPFDDAAAEAYGRLRAELARRGTPIGPNDLMIAAIALAYDLILVTHNTSEFSRVPRPASRRLGMNYSWATADTKRQARRRSPSVPPLRGNGIAGTANSRRLDHSGRRVFVGPRSSLTSAHLPAQGFSKVPLQVLTAPSPARICHRNAAEDGGLSHI